jgi:glycine C-acetyltransferase
MTGGVEEATAMVVELREHYGIFASIVVYPVIPKGHIIYRLIPSAVHTDKDIEETLEAFSATKKKLDAGEYKAETIPDMAEYSGKRFDYMTEIIFFLKKFQKLFTELFFIPVKQNLILYIFET